MIRGILRTHQLPADNSDILLKVKDMVFECKHTLVICMTYNYSYSFYLHILQYLHMQRVGLKLGSH